MSPYDEIERRLTNLQRWVVAGLAFMVTAAITLTCGIAYTAIHGSHSLSAEIDRSNQVLSCFVEQQLTRSIKGLPSNPYYRAHPDQLADALDTIRQERIDAIRAWGKCRTKGAA